MQDEALISASGLRHDEEAVRAAWRDIFVDPLVSLKTLRSHVQSPGGLSPVVDYRSGIASSSVVLRSVYWRFFHGLLPDPSFSEQFSGVCQKQRDDYDALRRRYLIAPDGRWAADCSSDSQYQSPSAHGGGSSSVETKAWDPLNLEGENPWKAWFAAQDLRATIRQDVERTFPDIPYFTIPSVRTSLTTILYLYSVLNPDVGYRQGMHELLAVILMIIDLDSLYPPPSSAAFLDPISRQAPELVLQEAMNATLSRVHVEHDAYTLFTSLMKAGKSWYEWRAEEGPRIPGQPTTQAPIITLCNHMQGEVLRRVDPQLWERFDTEGVEAQIWGIRWIRLILTRELPFQDAMKLWDGIFADSPELGLIEYICVAMLLRIRNELLNADYAMLLTNLLRYPGDSPDYPLSATLLLSQAMALRNSMSPTAGVQVVLQNHEVLGIKPAPEELEREATPLRRAPLARGRGRGGLVGSFASRAPPGVQGLAQGLFERAQASGLDKAFLSTVADLRRNLPDLSSPTATAYSYIPSLATSFSPAASPGLHTEDKSPFSSIPSSSSPLPSHRFAHGQRHDPLPVTEQKITRGIRDVERELAEVKLAMLGMGKALDGWLIELDGDDQGSRVAARESMGRLKDSLLNAASVETSSIVRDWGWSEALQAPPSRTTTPTSGVSISSADIPATLHPSSLQSPTVTPSIHLPSRNDTSARSQPRTPQATQIVAGMPPTPPGPEVHSPARQSDTNQQGVDMPFDPLATTAVHHQPAVRFNGSGRYDRGLQKPSHTNTQGAVDPLLGLDV